MTQPSAEEVRAMTGEMARFCNAAIPAGNTVTATVETAFASRQTIPGGMLVPGTAIRVLQWGRYSSTGLTPSITPRLRLGGAELFPTRAVTGLLADTNRPWHADSTFLVTDAGIVGTGLLLIDDNQVRIFGGPAVTGIDLTKANDLTASAAWGQAGCSITQQGFVAEVQRAIA